MLADLGWSVDASALPGLDDTPRANHPRAVGLIHSRGRFGYVAITSVTRSCWRPRLGGCAFPGQIKVTVIRSFEAVATAT